MNRHIVMLHSSQDTRTQDTISTKKATVWNVNNGMGWDGMGWDGTGWDTPMILYIYIFYICIYMCVRGAAS